ncbi:hypothetical protein MPTK1_5g24340 [Marchantia polymorpha subsp. ruderalis]|uniref:Uncharacterized protein n=2 Tax=Marchantia polymorpha TaxID=3197 RepID=A0AAF6BLS6_MARPO|nr:hypothetical protein MARPO_0010s0022 [Marchantia polymorpha]BBN12960.1 hypothetical protein Mp_5g24340 [Marchantia polymorpha subsp. ruderalis]|eukprot:PTQ46610.1 hypothetical protein MARPO_0010s0022 [Marchantia polymorpha]
MAAYLSKKTQHFCIVLISLRSIFHVFGDAAEVRQEPIRGRPQTIRPGATAGSSKLGVVIGIMSAVIFAGLVLLCCFCHKKEKLEGMFARSKSRVGPVPESELQTNDRVVAEQPSVTEV